MEQISTLIPDNEGNHLVVALSFYDDSYKEDILRIPGGFFELEIADIAIEKIDLAKPLGLRAFLKMNGWLLEQFLLFPNSVFSFICSTDPLDSRHEAMAPQRVRWELFEKLFMRCESDLSEHGIWTENITVGSDEYRTYAKVFYRTKHAPIIKVVTDL